MLVELGLGRGVLRREVVNLVDDQKALRPVAAAVLLVGSVVQAPDRASRGLVNAGAILPVGNGGLVCEVPTGEVKCDECGQTASAPEYIPHGPDCNQADVVSRWYAQTH